jgi:hypothetical protein
MRFRQIHLDFHTSEAIGGIGEEFSAGQFQEALREGHVDSITVFSKCHHGWAYHPSTANEQHPNLSFDLLRAQIDAAHAIGVNTPVYLSAGLDEKEARRHPEWLRRDVDDKTTWSDSFLKPGYHEFCMNTPYLDILCRQVEEVVTTYDVDGFFLDIVGVRDCVCHSCLESLAADGKDPLNPDDVRALGERVYANYTARINETIHKHRPGLPVFHNGGHIARGRRDLAHFNTHLELESLPTGGWGYDHFPLSVRYAGTLGMPFLGMTGKFHTSWGEFGGFKHPNALRYEAALALANGACISVGDQLHPSGRMDPATYALVGAAYAEVEAKEEWIKNAVNVADIGLLSAEATRISGDAERTGHGDTGAVRILLEGHYLFDVIDKESNFGDYKVLVLPDDVQIDEFLHGKIRDFIDAGGQILATGKSGLDPSSSQFILNLGAKYVGENAYQPDYLRPAFSIDVLGNAAFIVYEKGQKIEVAENGVELGAREDPYFNREWNHFCSHQHSPSSGVYGGPGITQGADGIYVAWPVFTDYAVKGSLFLKKTVQYALDRLLGQHKTLTTDLGAQGVVTLTRQSNSDRFVLHVLYASPVKRGNGIEIIEDIVKVHDVSVSLTGLPPIRSANLVPQGAPLSFTQSEQTVELTIPELECHQMVELNY